jgi:epoxyqueuosine reductase
MNAAELEQLADELGIDVVGAAAAEPYEETERHIRDRRARGLFADMRFTMANPRSLAIPSSCSRTRVPSFRLRSAITQTSRKGLPGHGRLPRYTWYDAYAELRGKLDELGRRLGGDYRVLVDENQHVDREAAARSGVGFYGKNTLLITRRFGSWVVLGTLVTDRELETTPPLALDCGSCTLCIEACPTGALDKPGTLDATKCLSYWTQSAHDPPEAYREALESRSTAATSARTSAPGTAASRSVAQANHSPRTRNRTLISSTGSTPTPPSFAGRYARLYVPRNDGRFLQRNARIALANEQVAAR